MNTATIENSAKMLGAADLVNLGFSRAIAYQLLNRADFPTVKIGRRLFVRYDRLIEWLEAHEGEEVAKA